MSDDLDRARINGALREAGVHPEGLPLIYPCGDRHIHCDHSHLNVVR
jgi:hypothetical protein